MFAGQGENDDAASCEQCISDFNKAGGCECMASDDCDQFNLIPDGCSNCGDKTEEYCSTKQG